MPRLSFPALAGLAALLCASPACAQTEPAVAVTVATKAKPKSVRRLQPAKAGTTPAAGRTPAAAAGLSRQAARIASVLGPDLTSSAGMPKAIFVQRFVSEAVHKFGGGGQRIVAPEQIAATETGLKKTVRDGAERWWNGADKAKTGRISRAAAQAVAIEQFRKLTGLAGDQAETERQSAIRRSSEQGAMQQFARYDVDGDGIVVRQEVERRITEKTERIERSALLAKAMLEDDSQGRGGLLDDAKATTILSDTFDALDLNRDGTLSTDEIPSSTPPTKPVASASATKRAMPARSAGRPRIARPVGIDEPPVNLGSYPSALRTAEPAMAR